MAPRLRQGGDPRPSSAHALCAGARAIRTLRRDRSDSQLTNLWEDCPFVGDDEAWAPWLEANTAPDSLRAELHRQVQRRQACVMPFAEAC